MSRKIKSTLDLPKEFDLKKYSDIDSMSDKDLFRQLSLRIDCYLDSIESNSKWEYAATTHFLEHGCDLSISFGQEDPFDEIKPDTPPDYYEWMKGGREFYERYMKNCKKSMSVSTGYGIGYLSREVLMYLSHMNDSEGPRSGMPVILDDNEFQFMLNEQDDPEKDGTLRAKLNDCVTLVTGQFDSLFLSIDISTPDDILLSEFKRLIPIWRQELNVEESLSINASWAIVRKKIIEYKVIPYIDLTIWACANKIIIPHGVMCVALFPYGERDIFSITQTIKPFIENLMTPESLEKLKQKISK
ncbi:DUF6387 family protein [Klebsiella quasipneumoniae]|uniref:DUF6387 family protein n=1 Tax=Klebsiella quasipneumoniae TaxID=1463165 RepID=UPI0018A27EB5|nr:DUF6387 family protein [Klebsiella quasipneumoniae]MBF7864411.1 hypothetical protein [Klebsiella quasipneumoniae]MBV0363076.1 hypothetical protein [Klebsiella quasipneumoniae]MDT9768379.1 DUF6387 family protein [Klebsiella quasipneumoniae]MDV0814187.1 DUF6387 family protein [Klebsiella quasipneumoniae subsp. quasipneumoniae]MDW3816543.1 hypothetical protein [Klebsiella quasipneumoniae]